MNLGLRAKIILLSLLVSMAAMAAITLSSANFFAGKHTRAHVSRSLAIAEGLAVQLERILSLGLSIHELQGFEEQCAEAVRHYPGLAYALVATPEGRILFHSDGPRMGACADDGADVRLTTLAGPPVAVIDLAEK